MDLDALDFCGVLDYVYALLAEGAASGLGTAMDQLDKVLTAAPWPDRATWGESPDAVAAQNAMLALAGGPAPLRSKESEPEEQ